MVNFICSMIKKLNQSSKIVANKIFDIFQNSYKIEAELIGVSNFPPLNRSVDKIQGAKTTFYGFLDNDELAAIIEVDVVDSCLEIDSLTVHPSYFRRGIAGKLIRFLLDNIVFSRAVVETATANLPAITLYEKHGFVEFKRWTPSHGIPKIALSIERLD